MNARILKTIVLKDLREVLRNTGAWVPAVIVPLIFMILMPLGVILIPRLVPGVAESLSGPQGFEQIKQYVTPFMGNALDGLNMQEAWITLTVGYMLAPFLLMMPLMLSTIIGAESFVGERERKTLEALIYTPATDAELFFSKVIASVVPAVLLAWVCFLLYGIVANVAAWPVMGRIWFPLINWWPLMLWLTPAIATLGMAVAVLISVRARTFMEAYQMSGSLVVLVLALLAGQVSGVLFLSPLVTLLVGLLVWIADAVMIWFGVKTFARPSLLARL
jgi:hypothetical protein